MKKKDGKLTLKEQGFYNRAAWKRARRLALQRDNYLCQNCRRQGRTKIARAVHHIKELESHPELALTLSNLESLCVHCHEETKARGGTRSLPKNVRIINIG